MRSLATTLKHDVSKRYRPGDGMLSNEEDRVKILEMTRIAREQWPEQKVGFFEGYPYTGGAGGGFGKQIDRQGILYDLCLRNAQTFLKKSERSEKWLEVLLYSSRSTQDIE